MATVRKRIGKSGAVSWQIDYRDPQGKRVRLNFKKRKTAEAELAKRVSLIAENRYLDVKKDYVTTFDELCEKYKENFKHQASYQTSKRHFIKGLKAYFGENTLLSNIRYVDLETYQNKLRQTPTMGGHVRTKAAVNRQVSCLRHMMTKGVEWELIEASPFNKGKALRLKENNERLRFLDAAEIDRLLDASPPSLRHFIIFCIHTGARKQEAVNLKWHQIKNGHIYFEKTKTDNPRQVPIDKDLEELIDKLKGKPKNNIINLAGNPQAPVNNRAGYVFLHKGEPFAPHAVQGLFKNACNRAGIPYGIKTPEGVTIHTLRHTFGSHLAIKGVSIRAIQTLMGHKSLQMTMRYAHLTPGVMQEAVAALNGLTSGHKVVTREENTKTANTQITENTPIFQPAL